MNKYAGTNFVILLSFFVFMSECVWGMEAESAGVVRQVDHILLATENPKAVYDFMTKELQFPIAWPYQDYSGFASGGVSVGNVNLEALLFNPARISTPSKIIGIAFEPEGSTEQIVETLNQRLINHSQPEPFEMGSGEKKSKLWTTMRLPDMLPGSLIFFCEYHFFSTSERRTRLHENLEKIQGGPLGIVHLSEIVIKVKDMTSALKKWLNLLRPHPLLEHHLFVLGEGPAIRFVKGEKDHISSLKFKVKSLSKARDFLSQKGLVGEVDGSTIKTNPAKFWEILFEFSE
ncbi:hypothetical protein ACFLT2_12635 [Acidobacteriota bacterium]